MVSSLLKPLTTGIQDQRIYYKPSFSPFVRLWNTTSRFTTQMIRLDFDSPPAFGTTAFFRLVRKGHLITRLFLVTTMPDIYTAQATAMAAADASGAQFLGPRFGWTNSLGNALISSITLSIGNTQIETLDSRLLEMIDEYTVPLEKTTIANRLMKRLDNGFTQTSFGNTPQPTVACTPLPFWFSRGDSGCAFPIDAILQDDVRVGVTFRGINGLYYTNSRAYVPGITGTDGANLWPMTNSPFYQADPSGSVIPGLEYDISAVPIPGITMPSIYLPGDTYLMAEYIYLDQPEANRFRLADLQVPIVQHYAIQPWPTQGLPNPCRDLFWMVQRVEAPSYNAHFLATRDLQAVTDSSSAIWWPDALGLSAVQPGFLQPAFLLSDSEPIGGVALLYEGSLVRFRSQTPALFRSVLPSWEQKKSPWVNRYYYNWSFGLYNGYTPWSKPKGEANLDKITQRDLVIDFNANRGSYNVNDVPKYYVYVWAATYNVLRVYGGRAGILFAY
jgi:Major capsid protein N-terminus/Large eukaryotic DNA virus major capsid protein